MKKRLTISVGENDYNEIKKYASDNDISLSEWIVSLIKEEINSEKYLNEYIQNLTKKNEASEIYEISKIKSRFLVELYDRDDNFCESHAYANTYDAVHAAQIYSKDPKRKVVLIFDGEDMSHLI